MKNTEDPPKVRPRITAKDIQNIIASESQSKPSGGGTDVNFIPASSGQSGGGTMEQSEEQKKDGKPSWNKFPWEGLPDTTEVDTAGINPSEYNPKEEEEQKEIIKTREAEPTYRPRTEETEFDSMDDNQTSLEAVNELGIPVRSKRKPKEKAEPTYRPRTEETEFEPIGNINEDEEEALNVLKELGISVGSKRKPKKEIIKTREAEPTYRPRTGEVKFNSLDDIPKDEPIYIAQDNLPEVLIEQKDNSPSYIDNVINNLKKVSNSIGDTYDNVTDTIGDLAVNAPSYLNRKAIQMGIVEADLEDDVEFKQVSVQENKVTNLKSEDENVVKTDVPNIITGGTKDHIVQDKHWKTLNNPASAPLSSHRNQFNAEEGFIYNTIPAKGNTNAPEELPENLGIAHFFIMDAIDDDSRKEGQKDVYSATNEELRTQSNRYKQGRDYRRKKGDDYVPVFTKINKNKIPYNYDKDGVHKLKVQYKKKEDITKEDNVVQNLVQYKLSDIDWDKEVKDIDIKGRSKQYTDDIRVIATTDGKPIPSLPVYVGGDKNRNRYGRFAGAGVVFLFEKDEVIYADDYSGSINNIKKEIQRLKDDYKLTDNELTLGFYDAGSYTAKPAADPKTGIINRNQFSDFNNKEESGSGIAIPKQ